MDIGASYGDTKIHQILKYEDSGARGIQHNFIINYVYIYVSSHIYIIKHLIDATREKQKMSN